jgi:ACS family hexuronate transporter-like MFS transporter
MMQRQNPPVEIMENTSHDSGAAVESRREFRDTAAPQTIGRFRWVICTLLFFSTTINYIDRAVLGILAPMLQKTIGWNEVQYGYIVMSFMTAYALGIVFVGRFIDWVGTRVGYAAAVAFWSVAAMSHSMARSALSFGIVRFMLGLGESGNFPAGIKTVAEWFPKKERALATGIFNSGTNLGATIAPILVPVIANRLGWQWAFLFTGFFSAVWLVVWLATYRRPQEHSKVSAAELAYINADQADPTSKIPWSNLLPHRQTWAFVVGKLMTDPVWFFLLFWLPKFFNSRYSLNASQFALPLIVIYNASAVGSIAGGWLPAKFLDLGWSVNRARKTAMAICAVAWLPMVLVGEVKSLWVAVALISLAAAAHQGWSANLFTLASDMFPRRAVASVVGIGGLGGASAMIAVALFVGLLLQWTGNNYVPVFMVAGSTYVVALLIIHALAPKLSAANI